MITPPSLLGAPPPAGRETADLDRLHEIALPLPGSGDTTRRWSVLAAWGRADLPLARLAEGHADAVAIAAEEGAELVVGASYGVWAARSGGTGAVLDDTGRVLSGTVRFCSGAHLLDRALVVALGEDGAVVCDVDVRDPRVVPVEGTWRAAGMVDSDSVDVELHDLPVERTVGKPGSYTARPGFWHGGAGVAAVWLGGAAGVVDDVVAALDPDRADAHQLAHLGALHTALTGTDAVLSTLAAAVDAEPGLPHTTAVWTARASAEAGVRTVLDLAPRIAGAATLSRADTLSPRLTDLGIYIRQHHGERDLAALGRRLLDDAGERS